MLDVRLKDHHSRATRHMELAGVALAKRQLERGPARGNVPPWSGIEDLDLHGTLAAIWVWRRSQELSGKTRFADNLRDAWAFVQGPARRMLPEALGLDASDEVAYDCAMLLRACLAEHVASGDARRALADGAARMLAAHLDGIRDFGGREFRDPGFLAWNLAEYARAVENRGLLSSAQRFVERAFGMKVPPRFEAEPGTQEGLFDFASTTATRIMAVVASEGTTPFTGAWLRERVAMGIPDKPLPRRLDASTWNACVAWALGRSYAISTDPRFLDGWTAILAELARQDTDRDGAIGRDASFTEPETLPTFYYALAVDAALVE